jgi:hypothetical protein
LTASLRRIALPAALVVLNGCAHFLPPERASVGPDDYTYLVRFGAAPLADIARLLVTERQRPLQLLALALQARLVGGGPLAAFVLPWLSSTVLLLCVYALLRTLLQKDAAAFLGAAAVGLLPQTVEVYHTAMYFNVNLALSLWLLCAAAFLRFLRGGGAPLLAASLALYAVALFWYEVGFFLPLVFAAWAWRVDRGRVRCALAFLPIAAFYFIYGHTSWLGHAPGAYGHAVGWDAKPLLHLLSYAAGPHAARALVYGLYGFTRLPFAWLVFVVALDAVLVVAFWRWLRDADMSHEPQALTMSALLAVGVLLPFAAQARGGIAGRHLIIPSIAFVLAVLSRALAAPRGRAIVATALAAALVTDQGNAWAQVVACRINHAVYAALLERRDALRTASHLVVDVHGLTERIPFTWTPVEFDQLNSYYGAQALEDWGLMMMTRLAAGTAGPAVHVAVGPLATEEGVLRFVEGRQTGSRSFEKAPLALRSSETVVVGFREIFGRDFARGLGSR